MTQSIAEIREPAPELEPAAADLFDGFISEQDYAQRRGVSVRTCQRDRQLRKAPPYIQLGRQVFYRTAALRAWLVKNERADALVASARRGAVARTIGRGVSVTGRRP
jgi:hypothetical protein